VIPLSSQEALTKACHRIGVIFEEHRYHQVFYILEDARSAGTAQRLDAREFERPTRGSEAAKAQGGIAAALEPLITDH